MIGGLVGTAANALFPGTAGSVGGYTLIGMAAFLAPMVGAPLTAILILFEMTGDYEIILPLLIAVISAMLVSGQISRFSLYTHHLHKKGVDLVRGREEGVLKTITVRDVMRKEVLTIPSSASFRHLSARFLAEHVDYFYLVDSDGALNGVVSFSDIRPYLMEEGLGDLVRVKDIASSNVISLTPQESLFDVLIKFGYKNVAVLPVISDLQSRKLIGIIHRKEVLEAYQRRIVSSIRKE
jgi:chloride channel protein, CIC family